MARLVSAVVLVAALLAGGCGRSEMPAGPRAKSYRTIRITADDTMRFSEVTLEASAGEGLRVELSNTGTRPRESMAHNWVLLKPASDPDVNAFCVAAASAPPSYLPTEGRSRVIAATKMLGPGETDAVEFVVPSQPAEYPFVCTFPGHFVMMKGWLVVK